MSEGPSGGGFPGRRREPDGALSDPRYARDAAALETALAAAIRAADVDPRAEQRAVAAFRAARDTGAHRARTRRRDDWRRREERRARRPLRMTLGVVFASLTLGGVAVAAIGSVASSSHGTGHGSAHPSAVAPGRPGDTASSASSGGLPPTDRPATAQDTEAHCRAYEHVRGRGKALGAKAWQELVTEAGGEAKVAAYCTEQLSRATAAPTKSADADKSGDTGKSSEGTAAGAGNGSSGASGSSGGTGKSGGSSGSGSGASGSSGGTGKSGGSGGAGGQGGGKHR
ncbi:hypothetical protein [Streptomyces camelliae]|uniref:Uncharacterized protein n=1 Tax=Streptomyces camelliae TaxID=3004093 RepID=A0ABY7P3K6_9ACTN|nr:hypothetical protein [Streptomyces sp. HUAS 2-6]WBO64987.1 hypothetical protein O1G22_20195 [Streptomyces sp. HUAS 2-6]